MTIKRILKVIGLSILIMIILMYLIYSFDVTLMNLSNVFFFTGIIYFFLGLIVVTGATEVFNSIGYLTRRMFLKPKGDAAYFKSFADYMEYKNTQNLGIKIKNKGFDVLIIGAIYIVLSIIIGMIL